MLTDHHHSPLRDPVMGLGGGRDSESGAQDPAGASRAGVESGTSMSPQMIQKDGTRVNLPALILTVGLFSVFCLGLGFVAGQEFGTRRFTGDSASESKVISAEIQKQHQQLDQIRTELKSSLALMNSKLDLTRTNPSQQGSASVHAEYQTIANELQGKLDSTHQLFASMTDLPSLMARVSQLLTRWEERKVSIVEEICPASDGLPARYPGKK